MIADVTKLVLAAALVVAGVAGYYAAAQAPIVVRVLAVAAGLAAGAAVAVFTAPGRAFVAFARDSYAEVRKVVWPTRKEAMQTTAVVFAFAVAMAIFLWLTDKTLEWVLYDLVLGWRRT